MPRPAFQPTMENTYIKIGKYFVSEDIFDWAAETFLSPEITHYTGMDPQGWWEGVDRSYQVLTPKGEALIKEGPRQKFLAVSNAYHKEQRLQGLPSTAAGHAKVLRENELLTENLDPFKAAGITIRQDKIDPRASTDTGPELVGPMTKLNMVARAMHAWQDPRDHLYVTNLPEKMFPDVEGLERHAEGQPINQKRVEYVDKIITGQMDKHIPLPTDISWDRVKNWRANWNDKKKKLEMFFELDDSRIIPLLNTSKFLGFNGNPACPDAVYMKMGDTPVKFTFIDGKVKMTSALAIKTWLADLEDATSITTSIKNRAVGARDLISGYDNWWHINRGTLRQKIFREAAKEAGERAIYLDDSVLEGVSITDPYGNPKKLHGAPLISVRRAGIHVKDYSVIDKDGNPMPRGILDTMIIAALGKINMIPELNNGFRISEDDKIRIYIPKLHGPEEVRFAAVDTFRFAEEVNELEPGTLEPSLMVEEGLTMLTVGPSLMPIKRSVGKANVGFLDLTASWIRANMEVGVFKPMNPLKASDWAKAYNSNAVDACLRAGFNGHGIIGGGMFELIRDMMSMVQQKGLMYSVTGFDNSWYPTPTAAVVGALFNFADHDPHARQLELLANLDSVSPEEFLEKMLTPQLASPEELTPEAIDREILDYMQDIMGYLDRWIKLRIGCSGILDINGDERMKDFATVRFASLLTGNKMYHGAITPERVLELLKEAALTKTPGFENWGANGDLMDDPTFKAATELVFNWDRQDYGYVEEVLMKYAEEASGNVIPFPARSEKDICVSTPLAELRPAA